jgi:hypothetical protein
MTSSRPLHALWLATACIVAAAGSAVAQPMTPRPTPVAVARAQRSNPYARPMRFVTYPGDALIRNDKLHVAWRLEHPAPGPIELQLVRDGGPPVISGTHYDNGPGVQLIDCWGLGHELGSDVCAFPIAQLTPGTYTLEVVQHGAVIGSTSIPLITMPSAAGSPPVLHVDPAFGALRGITDGKRFRAWIPVDARRPARFATMLLFRGTDVVASNNVVLEGPRLAPGLPLAWLQQVEVNTPGTARRGPDDPTTPTWDRAAVVLDRETVVAAWTHSTGDGELESVTPDAELATAAKHAAHTPLKRDLPELYRVAEIHTEAVVCAYASKPEVVKLFQQLDAQAEIQGGDDSDVARHEQRASEKWRPEDDRADARVHAAASRHAVRGDQAALRQIEAKIDRASAGFRDGCLARFEPSFKTWRAVLDAPRGTLPTRE